MATTGTTQDKRRPKGTGRVYQRGATWWIRYSIDGDRKDESSGSEVKREAEKLLKIRLGQLASGAVQMIARERSTAMAHLLELVKADYAAKKRKSTKDCQQRIDATIAPLIGPVKAAKFGDAAITQYINDRRAAGAEDATINRELAIVRRALRLSQRNKLVASVPRFELIPLDSAREGFIEYQQYRAILEKLPRHLACLFVVGYHLGMRLGELLSMKWKQVDLANKTIRLHGSITKNGEPRTAPIYGDMTAWLELQLADHQENWPDVPWVFHFGKRRIGRHIKGWKEVVAAAGLPDLLFHDLRRSAVNNMEQAGVPRKVAMSITGHKTENIYRRYNIVRRRDVAAAGAQLEALMKAEAARSAAPGVAVAR